MSKLSRLINFFLRLPRFAKKLIVLTLDIFLVGFSTWLAFSLRLEELFPLTGSLFLATIGSLLIGLPIFIGKGLYRAIFRYTGWLATIVLMRALLIYAAAYLIIFSIIKVEDVPRSIGLLQPMILSLCIAFSRLLAKSLLDHRVLGNYKNDVNSIALIYGAGSAGRQLASGLSQGVEIKPIGYIDDDAYLWRNLVDGLPVYPPSEVPNLIKSHGVTDILMAVPSAGRARQKEIFEALSEHLVHVRTLPGLSALANGVVKVGDVREVEIGDLLGRDPVKENAGLMHQNILGKVVLVTGAGGSIGSELCRQILVQKPKILVLFELSEVALYEIERSLLQASKETQIIPILGSVLNQSKLERVIRQFCVQTIYHAAAYKHVPIIEKNPAAGVWNNVFGTLRTVDAACQAGVEVLVLISTDKAVRPTSVMGCSKRVAELVLQAKSLQMGQLGEHLTKLTMVRFGNVLDSSGSVVPLFREQIKVGGPVTVTHPEIIRYFMTIPEAAQLVIQAGAVGEGGDVMLLDMGEPVKILELAKRMIHLSGFSHKSEVNPCGDIEVNFTGLRPGEKLYEELLIGDSAFPTCHPRIMRAAEYALGWKDLEVMLVELEAAISEENTDAIRSRLKQIVPEFNAY